MKYFKKDLKLNAVFVFAILFALFIIVISQPPADFPSRALDIKVAKGSSIASVADDLYNKNIIASKLFFKFGAAVISFNKGVLAGDYRFTEKQSAIRVAYRMVKGEQGLERVKVTIPEGTNVYDMAAIFLKKLPDFNAPRFVSLALPYEGYLFPDTYYFLENVESEEIIKTMENNFNNQIKSLDKEIMSSNRLLKDIITMASIVEEEANNTEDRRVVAGILWKRLKDGMLLQVDPPFYYITGKTNGVTYNDLKIDSPYNTYKYKGLPKGPISNPGLEAIKATLSPVSTSYYFYLTGKDGIMRYAEIYDGHLANKNIYLKGE